VARLFQSFDVECTQISLLLLLIIGRNIRDGHHVTIHIRLFPVQEGAVPAPGEDNNQQSFSHEILVLDHSEELARSWDGTYFLYLTDIPL
jgi:hypothetical protein